MACQAACLRKALAEAELVSLGRFHLRKVLQLGRGGAEQGGSEPHSHTQVSSTLKFYFSIVSMPRPLLSKGCFTLWLVMRRTSWVNCLSRMWRHGWARDATLAARTRKSYQSPWQSAAHTVSFVLCGHVPRSLRSGRSAIDRNWHRRGTIVRWQPPRRLATRASPRTATRRKAQLQPSLIIGRALQVEGLLCTAPMQARRRRQRSDQLMVIAQPLLHIVYAPLALKPVLVACHH